MEEPPSAYLAYYTKLAEGVAPFPRTLLVLAGQNDIFEAIIQRSH